MLHTTHRPPARDDARAMGIRWPDGLLSESDPAPVQHLRPRATSPILLTCDHGDNRVPERLALGVSKQDLARHIGYDIGIRAVGEMLSELIGAEFIAQRFSRLVIDCNRPPHRPDAMPQMVDGTEIPANCAMTPAEAAARVSEIFMPYHATIASSLDRRAARGESTVVICLHSFTPYHSDYPGPRPWPISLLFHREPDVSYRLRDLLSSEGLNVGMNEPYKVGDLTDYTVPVHAEARHLRTVLIEVRQDGIGNESGQREWAERLARHLPRVLERSEDAGLAGA